jgi:RNase H-like domain found in reverse transcriptase
MTPDENASPLHSKPVKPLSYTKLLRLARAHPLRNKLADLIRLNTDATLYADLDSEPATKITSKISAADKKAMTDDGLIRPVPSGTVKRFGRFFTVYEAAKNRRRAILWPEELNEFLDWEGDMSLKSCIEQMSEIQAGDWAVCYDLTASFYQCPLAIDVQPYYGFSDEQGNEFVYTRMVMGSAYAAELMDTITEILSTVNISNVRTTTHHVDNARWLGTKANVTTAGDQFVANCTAVDATWNHEPNVNVPHQLGPFCGVEYDYVLATTCAAGKMMGKLTHALQVFTADESVRNMCSLFGLMFHLTPIVRAATDQFYHVLKYYRRKCACLQRGETTLSDNAKLWGCVRQKLTTWIEFLGQNRPVTRPPSALACINLFTDASDVGWGGYLIDADGQVQVVAGAWSARDRHRSINEREAMAVYNTLTRFLPQLRQHHFNLHIDNTSVCWGLAKGRSAVYNLNARIAEVSALVRETGATFTVCYVPSAANHADHPSRFPHLYQTTAQLASPEWRVVDSDFHPTRKYKENKFEVASRFHRGATICA